MLNSRSHEEEVAIDKNPSQILTGDTTSHIKYLGQVLAVSSQQQKSRQNNIVEDNKEEDERFSIKNNIRVSNNQDLEDAHSQGHQMKFKAALTSGKD